MSQAFSFRDMAFYHLKCYIFVHSVAEKITLESQVRERQPVKNRMVENMCTRMLRWSKQTIYSAILLPSRRALIQYRFVVICIQS